MTLHLIEYLMVSNVIFEHQLDLHAPNWNIRLQWLSALWAAMLNAGMETGRVDSIEQLRTRVDAGMKMVPDADRTLRVADVIVNATDTGTWSGSTSRPAALELEMFLTPCSLRCGTW